MATGTIAQPDSYQDFSIVTHTVFSSISIAANDSTTKSATVTKSGYYPIGIVGYHTSGAGCTYGNFSSLRLSSRSSGSATIGAIIRNISTTAAISSMTLEVMILWAKIK